MMYQVWFLCSHMSEVTKNAFELDKKKLYGEYTIRLGPTGFSNKKTRFGKNVRVSTSRLPKSICPLLDDIEHLQVSTSPQCLQSHLEVRYLIVLSTKLVTVL